jgi:PilZ domain
MPSEPERRTVERRKIARQKSFLRGMIYFNNRRNAVDCLIRDISPDGARLIFSDAFSTPDVLDLYIPQKEQTLRTHVIWRHGQEVGVAFAQATQLDPAAETGDLAERVARLEMEIIGLKKLLKKMKTDAGPEFDVA